MDGKSFLNKVFTTLKKQYGLLWVADKFQKREITNNPPKIFLAICSCHKYKELREACRKTWLSKLPENIEYRFFVGKTDAPYEPEKDVVYLDVPDTYWELPQKTIAALLYSLGFEYDWYGKCDDDTFLFLDKLPEILSDEHECIGKVSFNKKWALGGAGYFMRRNVAEAFRHTIDNQRIKIPEKGCEDTVIGEIATKFGYKWIDSDRLCQYFKPENTELISQHKLNPEKMLEFWNAFNGSDSII